MKAQHASNEKARALMKTPREKKASIYTQAALAWWRVDGAWMIDVSLTTKREHAVQIEELPRRRATSHNRVQDGLIYTESVAASVLLHELLACKGEPPERFSIISKKDFAPFLKLLCSWLPVAQDGKANLHFATWIEQGKPLPAKRGGRRGGELWLMSEV